MKPSRPDHPSAAAPSPLPISTVEARHVALRLVAFYEGEAACRRAGPGRERYQRLADALRLLVHLSPL